MNPNELLKATKEADDRPLNWHWFLVGMGIGMTILSIVIFIFGKGC